MSAAKADAQAANVAAHEAELRLKHSSAQLAEMKKTMKGAEKEISKLQKEVEEAEGELKRIAT